MADVVPAQPTTPTPVASKTVLIDNYDSFTWNVVQYLSELGADVHVYRNDAITLEQLISLQPKNIVISPGPGHPLHDSGISIDVIKHFAGKVPILGVCMGLQCLYAAFTGEVAYAGEILHGKTSKVRHDGKGLYYGVPQGIVGTRYHSLAAQLPSLPDELAVTSTTESGVVMGIRHKQLTIEAMQYHPESILSEGGKDMMRNFLNLRGGLWSENPQVGLSGPSNAQAGKTALANGTVGKAALPTILEKIHTQRLVDIAEAKAAPGGSPRDLAALLSLDVAPPLVDFVARVRATAQLGLPGVMAEVKRASPSKGDIDISANAASQALAYARGGASVISVLTEPKWFKGSLNDMRLAREAISRLPNRPAVLRKDFIVDTYQILEARLYGADTVLLIVAMLSDEKLHELYAYAKSLGMEPLVEVNNREEMTRALALNPRAIGVNNRNLHDFNVDMGTTSRLADMVKGRDTVLCALSGITGREDVVRYQEQGVGAVLVGEALMRATDKGAFIHGLLGLDSPASATTNGVTPSRPLVKICGLRSKASAMAAAEAGADLVGIIFAESKRKVKIAVAREMVRALRQRTAPSSAPAHDGSVPSSDSPAKATSVVHQADWFSHHHFTLASCARSARRPLVVGVFRNQPLEHILHVVEQVGLDLVQLHGDPAQEPVEWARWIPVPVVKVFGVEVGSSQGEGADANGAEVRRREALRDVRREGYHQHVLLDAKVAGGDSGGHGKAFDWSIARRVASGESPVSSAGTSSANASSKLPIFLAGGLDATNVAKAIEMVEPAVVDVSSGVEGADGEKEVEKMKAFVAAVKGA